jgi:hypothetical protein
MWVSIKKSTSGSPMGSPASVPPVERGDDDALEQPHVSNAIIPVSRQLRFLILKIVSIKNNRRTSIGISSAQRLSLAF